MSSEAEPAELVDKAEDTEKQHVFAAPAPKPATGGSLLGLDRLAREKRAANQAKESAARKRTSMMEDDDLQDGNDDARDPGASTARGGTFGNPSKRQFRGHRVETPSHPGGVNEETRREIDDRRKERHRGVRGETARGGGDRSRDRDHRSRDGDHRSRDRDRDVTAKGRNGEGT